MPCGVPFSSTMLTTPVPDLRLPPEVYHPRKTGLRGIPVVEDLVQCRNRPPPEEYPFRKVGVRGIPVVEDLSQRGTGLRLRNTP